jgi:RecA/RadA recombinase
MAKKEEASSTNMLDLVKDLNKKFGVNTATFCASHQPDPNRIPSGVFPIDFITGGGIPVWHSTCLWGSFKSGKSSLAGDFISMSQKICWKCFRMEKECICSTPALKMKAAIENIEGTMNPLWYSRIGVNIEELVAIEADYGEQYSDIAEAVLSSDDCGLLVVDSLAALVPSVEMEGSAEDDYYANQAKLIGRMVRRLKQRLIREKKRGHPCAILFINQMRTNLKVKFGNPESQSGGFQMMHEYSLLLRVAKISENAQDKNRFKKSDDSASAGIARHSVSVKSNKVTILAKSAEFVRATECFSDLSLMPGQADDLKVLMDYAKRFDIIRKEGNKWKFFNLNANTLSDIENVLRKVPEQRMKTTRSIIEASKKELFSGKDTETCVEPEDGESAE